MKKYYILFILLIFSLVVTSQTLELGGVTVPAHLYSKQEKLLLNGAALREKCFLDLYVCGLYLASKSTDAKKTMNSNEKMAIRLQIVSGMVTNKLMQQAVRDGFEKSTNNNTFSIKDKIEIIINAFSEQINENDVFEIFYSPTDGSTIYKNGLLKAKIEGLFFKQALFGIWLGDNPAHKELREALMQG